VRQYSANLPSTIGFRRRSLIFGQAFAVADLSAASRLAHTHAESTTWLSDSALALRAASSRSTGGGATAAECAQVN
jgi:hypothetical protein